MQKPLSHGTCPAAASIQVRARCCNGASSPRAPAAAQANMGNLFQQDRNRPGIRGRAAPQSIFWLQQAGDLPWEPRAQRIQLPAALLRNRTEETQCRSQRRFWAEDACQKAAKATYCNPCASLGYSLSSSSRHGHSAKPALAKESEEEKMSTKRVVPADCTKLGRQVTQTPPLHHRICKSKCQDPEQSTGGLCQTQPKH